MSLRLLANENVPGDLVAALVGAGHEVEWVRRTSPGIDDRTVLEWARRDRLILLPFDKDFGELARRAPMPSGCGVILLRVRLSAPWGAAITRILSTIGSRADWADHYSVVDESRVRMRRLDAGE